MYNNSIFIFRRDLRLEDNIGLLKCCESSELVYTIFIFTPEQVKDNDYKSNNAVQFMCNALDDLDKLLKNRGGKLYLFYDDNIKVLKKIVKELNIDSIFENRDMTPYARDRQNKIKKMCKKIGIDYNLEEDVTLLPMGTIFTGTDEPYQIYTPFYRNAKKNKIPEPRKNNYSNFSKKKIKSKEISKKDMNKFFEKNTNTIIETRQDALKILNNIKKHKNYKKTRNNPNIKTTQLSPHLHFGTISIREAYHKILNELGKDHELIKQLWWREFYMYITNYYIENYKKESFTQEKYNKIVWSKSKKKLELWKKGKTGCPIVDAGMRSMNKTGFMHNRVRMIVAMYLVFYLKIHWKEGEKYFSQKLVDIDFSNNNGNWRWVAGISSWSNPYFRAFSMNSQSERFDPKGEYIKKWIPELKNVNHKHLHEWEKYYNEYDIDYPEPIIDMTNARKKGIDMFKKI